MLRLQTLCVVLALLAAQRVAAQAVHLAALEASAVRARPQLGIASARVAETQAGVAAAQSAYAPTLSLLGEASVLPGQQTKK
ncbi:MAG: hypothetical protein RL701_1272, partial [Pseudomonadota bacterium]